MDRGRSDSLATVSTLDIYVGDDLLDLATTIASLAYHQALELRDLIQPGRKLHVIVSVIT
jgi:hypothetical protein